VGLFSLIRAKHNLVFKLVIVTVVSVWVAWLLPGKLVQGHRVDSLTTVWPYPDVIPAQDFLIRKTDGEIRSEKAAIIASSPLFFEWTNVEKQNKIDYLNQQFKGLEREYLKSMLDSIHNSGIIDEVSELITHRPLYILNGNYAEAAALSDFLTVREAALKVNKRMADLGYKGDYITCIAVTLVYERTRSEQNLNNHLQQLSVYKSILKAGQPLVRQGETLNENKRFLINRYYFMLNEGKQNDLSSIAGRLLLSFILMFTLLVFLAFFRRAIFGQNRQVAFLFLLLVGIVSASAFFYRYGLNLLLIPFMLVPIVVRVFFDGRTALFTHLMIVLCVSFFVPDKLLFILTELIPGIGTLFVVAEMRKRQQILNAAALIFIFYVFVYGAYNMGFGSTALLMAPSSYIPFAISSMLVLLAYPIIYLIEKIFGFISDFKLLELIDLNHPLLRRLSQEVPGTFQHSLQVANLAEEAIYYIGGNSLLVRAGAMYHDIGKLKNPMYFTENQLAGFSPHQEMEPIESARLIINHVIEGVELAKKYNLPEQIIDFIRTHHGTTSVRYFLHLFRKQGHESKVAESQFRYPGPIPFSKETAVLMIADGVEAASRSLKTHDAVSISDLVDQIIEYKIVNNQFINADITFKDITTIRKIFKKRLMNIYHARIEYPS
jgi:putative nucleotidyltransferase with HDIG domain